MNPKEPSSGKMSREELGDTSRLSSTLLASRIAVKRTGNAIDGSA